MKNFYMRCTKYRKGKENFYDGIKDKPDDEVYRLFYPNKFAVETMFKVSEYDYIHNELKRVGVTLKLLHQEYRDFCNKEGLIPVGYTRFTEGYSHTLTSVIFLII